MNATANGTGRRHKDGIKKARQKPPTVEVRLESIPAAIRDLERFVCWRWTWNERGYWDKPPVNARTGGLADTTDPETWATLAEALAFVRAGKADGIGFCLGEPWAGIDLDDCIDPDTGLIDPWARKLLGRLNSYTDRSPTLTGCKVLVRAKLPPGRRKMDPVEFYDATRYFTLTGHLLEGFPAEPQERQAVVEEVYAETVRQYEAKKRKPAKDKAASETNGTLPTDDQEIIRRLCAERDGKGKGLWDGGLEGYPSASEADAALCCKIGWYTGRDPDRVERIFGQSSRARAKWTERTDYRKRTVQGALDQLTSFFDWSREEKKQESQGFHQTDRGHAERVIERHGRDLRYCAPMKTWFVWDQKRWAEDATNETTWRVKETQRGLFQWATAELRKLGEVGDDPEKQAAAAALMATVKDCLAWEAQRKIVATLDSMKSERGVPILPDRFDADAMLLNTLTGTLDLRTGELRPHRREDLITKIAPVAYDPDAACPLWESCLHAWMLGRTALINYLRRVAGYAATADVSEQCLWFFHGGGANGKSTYLNTLRGVLGDYAMQAVSELLLQKSLETHPTERADLLGRRMVATVETDDGRRLAESFTKQLTGGESLRARKMRQDFIEIPPTWKIFLAANYKPTIRGTDTGVWRRIKLVPWDATIPPERRDKQLDAKLRAEWPGILAWIVRGAREWLRDGLQEPQEVTEATDAYRAEQDALGEFLRECCTEASGVSVRASALHDAFEKWTGQSVTRNAFASLMELKGYRTQKDWRGYKVYAGLLLDHGDPGDPPG